jgi:hypothetical protein
MLGYPPHSNNNRYYMSVIKIIILSLFILLWIVPSILWHFIATPEQKKVAKELYHKEFEKLKLHNSAYQAMQKNDFHFSVPFMK